MAGPECRLEPTVQRRNHSTITPTVDDIHDDDRSAFSPRTPTLQIGRSSTKYLWVILAVPESHVALKAEHASNFSAVMIVVHMYRLGHTADCAHTTLRPDHLAKLTNRQVVLPLEMVANAPGSSTSLAVGIEAALALLVAPPLGMRLDCFAAWTPPVPIRNLHSFADGASTPLRTRAVTGIRTATEAFLAIER
jgi:hypothetical protein